MTRATAPLPFDEIADIIESFEAEIEDGGPDASIICIPIHDVNKLITHIHAQYAVLAEWDKRIEGLEAGRAPLLGTVRQALCGLRKFIDSTPYAADTRITEDIETVLRALYEGALYRQDIRRIAEILGIQYHMTQRVPTFVDTVREWSNSYNRVLAKVQSAESKHGELKPLARITNNREE
jgi:hypothetical protein